MSLRHPVAVAFFLGVAAVAGVALLPSADVSAQGEEDTVYQCPMHPQIIHEEAGRCELCKMHLKPVPRAAAYAKKASWEQKQVAEKGASRAATSSPPARTPGVPKKAPAAERKTPTPTRAATAAEGAWTCPMHPDVQADAEGRCPVCGMELVPRDQLHEHADDVRAHDTWVCPMHPQVVTDEAGTCPICGMDLVEKGAAADERAVATTPRKIKHWVDPIDPTVTADGPGTSPAGYELVPVYEEQGGGAVVLVDPVVVQNMGVRIAPAARRPIFRHIRALGTVDVAEDQVAVVNLRFSGWVEQLYVDETGVKVRRGQALAGVYSPELVAAQEELLLALRTQGAGTPLAESAKRRLAFFGMSDADVAQLVSKREVLRTITVRAPREGFVLHKNVVQGARVMAGADLFRIGNLQNIWINAEVYESDAPWVELDAPATMELSFQQGRVYSGKVAYVYPTLNAKTRTLTVRLEFENPGLSLKPGMFATVRIEARRKDGALAIPTEAIIHTGERQIVFVALGLGRYGKREIVTGLVADRHLTEVLAGLVEGERVVVSGQFLLDSESQLQEAVQKLLDARLHANAPGADAATRAAADDGHAHEAGATYWTCPMHPTVVQDGPGSCPICGMDLVEKKR